jgi:hypothetical protein
MERHWMAHSLPVHGGLEILVLCPFLKAYEGPLVSLLSHKQLHIRNQLTSLATALPQTTEYLMLDVPHEWDPRLFLKPTNSQAWKIFPQLKRLFIRFQMLAVVDLVRLHELLKLEQYFDGTSVVFAFRLDFQYAPIVDGKSPQPNNSS